MVLQTPHGRHRGHTRVGGVESLTGLRNQTRERLTAGCLIESAFLQYRRLTRWIAYLLGGASPNSPRIGSEAFGEAGAFFWPVLGSGKKVAYRAGNTANVKMVTTNGPPVMANTWSPERRRVEQRQPTRGVLAVSLDSGCRRRVYKLVCRSLIRLVGGLDVAVTAADLLNGRVLPFLDGHEVKLLHVLTNRCSEYYGNPERHE
jgi:hypothetical protein